MKIELSNIKKASNEAFKNIKEAFFETH